MMYTYNLPAVKNYRFDLNQAKELKAFLREYGWVVIKNIATTTEAETIIQQQWDFIEHLGTGVNRNKTETWYQGGFWPGNISSGQVLAPYVGQSAPAWTARQLLKVKAVFALLWGTSNLKVSFDTWNVVRPYTLASNRTKPLPPHIDQNPNTKPNLECYQGLLNLKPSQIEDGGTMLYSKSHTFFKETTKYANKTGDWVIISGDLLKKCYQTMVCPSLEVGDMLVWDSRLIHGVTPPQKGFKDHKGCKEFRRSVVYVCMTPISKIKDKVLKLRKEYYEKGITTNHWPSEVIKKKLTPRYPRKIPYKETKYQKVKLKDESLV